MKHKTLFQSESEIAALSFRYEELLKDTINAIRERLDDGQLFDFDEEGFEDEAGNDLNAIDKEKVYFNYMSTYPIDTLCFVDALNILSIIDRINLKNSQNTIN